MGRVFADARRWTAEGTRLLLEGVAGLDESGFSAPSGLPGWTRGHLVAHLSSNAEALGNLVHWAATGVETPMYASTEARAAGIAKGGTMSAEALGSWLTTSAETLEKAMDRLTEEQWQHEIVTAQGRTVPAAEIPWLRAREVCVHAVDLNRGIGFAELPEDFLTTLVGEITAKRGLTELPHGRLPEVAAWLAGRPHTLADAAALGPWL
ncbi:maleylpyruvate isomerase family mycothiol-dependent enzyme [Streptomyces sp. SID8361]|uniref:maleylpyruvate isomerase family mycothiol-dependent enzyme n=1 Tax=Streptomyces sp. MnatMP-M27 TaxID=1839768 RepID=UPI00081E8120|nr:maleylpyruvate isomerase family mycothiol-dependent enzyme [Streptomyces sp. MnatMP-M27]MYU12791.1 maleylpyruvate isomerase family mycothiol-dependent enzyme [Streptomyces sp. SID8361]SCF95114.1 maleylpyruvate isomerase [Streptomyces sp. MnatMP-M27]